MRLESVWDRYAVYDEDGFVCGIREDAPENAKEAYAEYLTEKEAAAEAGYITK